MSQNELVVENEASARQSPPRQMFANFDHGFYRATYPDVRAAGLSDAALEDHWMTYGRYEVADGRRSLSADFDEMKYLLLRPDVKSAIETGAFACAYDHWLQFGRAENGPNGPGNAFLRRPRQLPAILTNEHIARWDRDGFLILPGLIPTERCDGLADRIDFLWSERSMAPPVSIDVSLHNDRSARIRFKDAQEESRFTPYKLNDLFLFDEYVQDLALDETLCTILRWILDAEPACSASLNFERGSTQAFHQDTLYMPGKTTGGMTAAWFALEDVLPGAGPLAYYPGSHQIPLYHFSTGQPHQVDAEFGAYHEYMFAQIEQRGLRAETFLPRKGDVLIWHERLFHSGSPITDMSATRRSLVTHYWRADELPYGNTRPVRGASIWDRDPV